ncbi:Glycine cleavage system H protein [Cladobotryum mycophilum]|uniref:Glycine cleavage system H protein n=1 Tax=Cladobotryum mycophilum TaxID=491253 RepID=A0ABR0SPM2_9HYPO
MASIAATLRAARPAVMRLAPRAAARSFSTSRISLVRKYAESHEWVDLSADGKTGYIGITEYAAKQLGDVVFVELPEVGAAIGAGEPIGAVESVKSASDVLTPIPCKVLKVNTALEETPKNINSLPEDDSAGGGWIAKIEVTEDGAEIFDTLMDAETYKASIAEE